MTDTAAPISTAKAPAGLLGKLVEIDLARIRELVGESHRYLMGLIDAAGFDIHHG